MSQRSVMIVGAGLMQLPAIRTALDMGFHVIASDRNPDAPGLALADHALVLDIKDVEGHVAFARANADRLTIAGAFAGADCAVTVAAITNALNLPGIPIEVAVASNNKSTMKKKWLADKVPTPFSVEVKSVEEARRALDKMGLPLIVKAVDNAASRGSKKISSEAELSDAFEDAKWHSSTRTAIVEQFVDGDEQSVETVVYQGEHYRFGIVDRHFGFAPYLIEIGHTNPSSLPQDAQEQIYHVVQRAAISLGITFGPAKADMILTKKGPMILEMAARLSGGWHSQCTTPLATGLDPIRTVLGLSTGGTMDISDTVPIYHRVSVCKAVFPAPGKITKISGVEESLKIKGVEKALLVVREGDIITEYNNCANRVCYLITVGDTHDEAIKHWQEAAQTVRIETIPVE